MFILFSFYFQKLSNFCLPVFFQYVLLYLGILNGGSRDTISISDNDCNEDPEDPLDVGDMVIGDGFLSDLLSVVPVEGDCESESNDDSGDTLQDISYSQENDIKYLRDEIKLLRQQNLRLLTHQKINTERIRRLEAELSKADQKDDEIWLQNPFAKAEYYR